MWVGIVGWTHPKTISLSTGAPQECVVSPLCLFNHCAPTSSTNHIVKFPDDMTVVGLIANNDETNYRNKALVFLQKQQTLPECRKD